MASKQGKRIIKQTVHQNKVTDSKTTIGETTGSFRLELKSFPQLTPYLPGIILFFIFLIICFATYKDYGVCWDEPMQRAPGVLSFDYIFNGSQELFNTQTDNHGAGYELLLVIFERMFGLTDTRDIYQMRHLVTNLLYLISALSAYILIYRLYKNKFLASIGFLMLVLAPRLYAHSFFNSKDIPFMCFITIILAYSHIAFEKNKPKNYLILGMLVGYATSIRIMGVLIGAILLGCIVLDLFSVLKNKEETKKHLISISLYIVGSVFMLYLGWPYLWKHPIQNFFESFAVLAHFMYKGSVLIGGQFIPAYKLPWTYFPTWFFISNPEIWLFAGLAGIVLFFIMFIKSPTVYFKNTNQRHLLIYLLCFFGPILAVILMHSVIYDDWRHLYFVYPPFVLLAIYFLNYLLQTKYQKIVLGICGFQILLTGFFMIQNHPFNQVYFNYFISHNKEYLRKNYDLEYWGCGYKQALEYLLTKVPNGKILVNSEKQVLYSNNLMILPSEDRERFVFTDPEKADFFITNYRDHPYDYPGIKNEYSVSVLNSSVFTVFRQEKEPVKQKQIREQTIVDLQKAIVLNRDDCYAHAQLGDAFFRNSQYDSALSHHLTALQLNESSVIINDLAGNYFGKQRYREAIALCKKAVEINPKDVSTETNMGLVYMRLSNYDSAIIVLRSAANTDPKYTNAYINLAITYKALNKMDSAKKYEIEAQKTNPQFRLQ